MMLGLFAADPFAKGEPIAIYRGKRTTQRPYGAYALEMSDGTAIDATESKCSARYANFARTRSQTNAAFVERGNRGILVATRPIVPGEEIAVWNGRARVEYPPNARIEDVYAANRAYFGARTKQTAKKSTGGKRQSPRRSKSRSPQSSTGGERPAESVEDGADESEGESTSQDSETKVVYRVEDQAFRRIGLEPSANAWIRDDEYDSRDTVRVKNVYHPSVSHTVAVNDLSPKMYIYEDDTKAKYFKWNLLLSHMNELVIQSTETNKTMHLPHLLCYETSCTYAYKNIDHKMIPCEIHGFDEAGSVYVVLLTADKSRRIKKGQFRVMSAYDLIKLAGSVYDNDGRKQYIVDTSHRSSLLPYDEATVIDAYGGELHIQDREDASTTGESSDESESENENESDSDSESDKWSERDSNSDSESETHNESYEDPAEVLDKEELKNAYNVLRLEFTDSTPTEPERKLVKKAYFDLMRKHHTDKPGGDNELAKAINGAKETIGKLRFPKYLFGKTRVSRATRAS